MTPLVLTLAMLTATDERWDHHGAVGLLVAASGLHKDSNAGVENGWRGGFDLGGTFNVGYGSGELVLLARATFGTQKLGGWYNTPPVCAGGLAVDSGRYRVVPTGSAFDCAQPDGHFHELDSSLMLGYRGYFGDRFKTLFDLDAAVHMTPYITVGPRVAVGVQYELTNVIGLYSTLGASLGFGEILQFKVELLVGFHFRSYLLE